MSFTSAAKLGPYQIRSLLGSGGMGEVITLITTVNIQPYRTILSLLNIKFARAQPLYPLRITMIEECSCLPVQSPDRTHILVA